MTRWIVVRDLPQEGDLDTECAIVSAEESFQAAEAGAELLMAEAPIEGGDHTEEKVAVIDIHGEREPEWFSFGLRAERCELQCCGGADTKDGHGGFCSLHKSEEPE